MAMLVQLSSLLVLPLSLSLGVPGDSQQPWHRVSARVSARGHACGSLWPVRPLLDRF